jgi:hypothetical protein
VANNLGASRRNAFLNGALNALVLAVVPLLVFIIGSLVVMLADYSGSGRWVDSIRGGLDIWYVMHGVGLSVSKGNIAGVATPAFVFQLAPLGTIALVYLFGRRTAKSFSGSEELWPGWVGAIATYWLIAFFLTPLASTKSVAPVASQAAFLPALVFGASVILTGLFTRTGRGASREREAFYRWIDGFAERNWYLGSLGTPVLRAGSGIVAGLVAVSSLVLGILLLLNWIGVIRLYESLQSTLAGGFALTLGQLAYLPNFVVYTASWFTGTGFSIGTGSHVSPMGTELGPIPVLPVFGAIPAGAVSFGIIAIAVPIAISFFATAAIKRHAEAVRFNFASPLAAALSVGLGVGLVAAVELGVLGFSASGSLGPDRLSFFGVNPWMLALVTFVEVVPAATLAAFYSAKPQKANPIPEHLKR